MVIYTPWLQQGKGGEGPSLKGGGEHVAQNNSGSGGEAGRHLLPHKVVQGRVRCDLR